MSAMITACFVLIKWTLHGKYNVNQARPCDHRPTEQLSTALCCPNSVQLKPSSQTSLSLSVCHGQVQALMATVHLNYILYDICDCVK